MLIHFIFFFFFLYPSLIKIFDGKVDIDETMHKSPIRLIKLLDG